MRRGRPAYSLRSCGRKQPDTKFGRSRKRKIKGMVLRKGVLPMRCVVTVAVMLGIGGCAASPEPRVASGSSSLFAAEKLIDAFYSFDPVPLRAALSNAQASEAQIIYYQGWAEGGNYAVLKRKPCRLTGVAEVSCEITVRDDLIAALGTGYWVTDTFHLSFRGGRIVKVRTSSNDPPDFERALDWLKRERPDLMTGPCRGFFAGGPTPQACVRAVVTGFAAYRDRRSA